MVGKGCGKPIEVCLSFGTGAIVLREKSEDKRYVPPASVAETYMNMARERGKL